MTENTDDFDEEIDEELFADLEDAEIDEGVEEPESMDDTPGFEAGERLRNGAGKLGWNALGLVGGFMSGASRKLPFAAKLHKRMAIKSIENYHKKSGGDAIGIDARAGQQLDLIPIKYRAPEDCDQGEKPGWKAKGEDKIWNAGSEGRVVDYLGRTPIVALDRDSHVEAGWLAPRIAEAVELDNYDPVFTDPEFNVTIDAMGGQPGPQARADGGYGYDLDLQDPGTWMGDAIVDLDSGDGYDGMRVSFRKAKQWRAETATTQEMQMQEDRGYLRGLAAGHEGPSVAKLLLLCGAIIVGALAVILLGPDLVGGSDGGGINPMALYPLLG